MAIVTNERYPRAATQKDDRDEPASRTGSTKPSAKRLPPTNDSTQLYFPPAPLRIPMERDKPR
ncbi:hypothetical protein N7539_008270 [Penicillium diatomitis]|uniref:Uncharacterized protein n=1 Tax=Penicillium diatomitis TaxID=2819901 RepID=A0A9W9WTI8_9EURO|nr:uncharacterized protein N7539_008270 [Penicillium diatomitis]KAJ5475204.1 hypothetical protein N7539_008270 [Penicillium diatomitis]